MPRRKTLRIPDEGVCAGHPCDDCDRCKNGDCCGGDVGEAGLPLEGSWPHHSYGVVGVVEETGAVQRCHCCGEWFENLARHVKAHGLTADAYKAMWGLNSTQSLVGKYLRAVRSSLGVEFGAGHLAGHEMRPTSEQRSRWARNREARAQTRLARGEQPRAAEGVWVPAEDGVIVAKLAKKS